MGSSLAFRNFLLRFLFLAWAASGCVAGVGFQPVSPDELHMTSEPAVPGAPAIILYRQVDRDDNIRTGHEDDYVRIKILTEEGRKYADVEIPFYRETEDNIVNIHARTIRPDGTIANFDGKVFEKSIVKSRGVRYLAKTFTLPDVQPGSVIEYFYTLDLSEHYYYGSQWILSNELFTKAAKFTLKPFEPDNEKLILRWTWNWLPAGTAQPQQGPDHVIRLEAQNIPAFQREDFMPPETELKSRVEFIYSQDTFEPDTDKFWRGVAKRRYNELENFVGKHNSLQDVVTQIVSASDTPEMKLRKIYDRVQQIRNTSYEPRKTEEEKKRAKEKPPANVEELWKRGYGDGKDITWVYLALVRTAGFEAYGCWVADRRRYFFNPKTEESHKLDANVVLVRLDGKDLYFDPGAAFTPFGLLTWSETGTTGLRLDKEGGSWIQTPLPPSSASRNEREAKLRLTEAGDLDGKLTMTYTGLSGMYWRLRERNSDEVEHKRLLEELAKEQVPAAAEVTLTGLPDWASSAKPLVAEFDIKIPGWISGAGKRALLPVGIFTAQEKHLFEHASRVHPIYVEYPYQKIDDVTIDLPLGWQVSSIPPISNQDAHIVLYNLKVENEKTALHITRMLNLDFLMLDPKYYAALRSFFQAVNSGDEQQAVLQPGVAVTSN